MPTSSTLPRAEAPPDQGARYRAVRELTERLALFSLHDALTIESHPKTST